MFEDVVCTDFQLKTNDGKVLKAHKTILAARSQVFYAMLKPDTKEAKESSVDVPDFDSKVMRELLRFIYCCEVERVDEMAHNLVYAAEKYQIDELKEVCIESLICSLSIENALKSFVIADYINAEELTRECLDIIIRFALFNLILFQFFIYTISAITRPLARLRSSNNCRKIF